MVMGKPRRKIIMYKNMTRKGLAFGAGIALVASGLASVPAQAAGNINDNEVGLVPRSGTEYGMILSNVFDLKSTVSSGAAVGTANLKWAVTDPDKEVRFDFDGNTADDSTSRVLLASIADVSAGTAATIAVTSNVATLTDADSPYGNAAVGDVVTFTGLNSAGITSAFTGNVVLTAAAAGAISFALTNVNFVSEATSAGAVVEISNNVGLDTAAIVAVGSLGGGMTGLAASTRAADGSFVIDTAVDVTSAQTNVLRLVSTSTDAHTVTVQAWIDSNSDGLIDGTENASSVRTITFVTDASGAAAVTVAQPISGLATWIADVSFASTINASQITGSRLGLGLGVIEAGVLEDASTSSTVASNAFTAENALTYNSTANHWRLETSGVAGVPVVADYVSATDNTFAAGFTYVAEFVLDGTPQGARVYKSTTSAVADAVANVSADRSVNVLKNSATSYTVRATTTAVSVSAKVTKSTVAVANAAVQVTITRNALDSKSTITAGGKTLTSTTAGGSITFATTTDATGKAVVAITNSVGKAADSISVAMTHAGLTSSATTFAWAVPTAAGAEFTRDGNFTGADATDVLGITQGAALSLNYNVFDEFGASPAANHRVLVTYTPIGNVSGAAQLQVVKSTTVSGTSAGFSLTDTSTVLGTYSVVAKLQKLNTATGDYDLGDADTITTTVNVQADLTPVTVTVVGTVQGTSAIEAEILVAADIRADKNQDTPAYTDAGRYNVAGSVVNAAGVPIVGAQVLLTAPAGTAFEVGNVYTLSTATVTTDSVGAYTAKLFSQKGGKFTVTATAGTATATTVTSLVFPAANTGTGSALTLDIPASAMPGTSFTATATLVDKFGNPVVAVSGTNNVLVSVDYTGPGVTVGTLPTSFNAAGELKFNVLLGTNDTGTITVVVRYDGDTASSTNLNDYSVTKSVVVGAPVAAEKVNVGSFKGYVALYAKGYAGQKMSAIVAGKWIVVASLATDFERVVRYTGAGYDIVTTIYIDGVKVQTFNVTTK
jgi:hypothetical protein